MRILHVLGKLDRGGVETWLVQVMRHIDRTKYQFDFLVHTTKPGAYDDEVRAMGGQILLCPSPSNPVLYGRNFLRLLREHGPYDVVHSHVHYFSGYVLLLAKLAGVRCRIAHSHNDTSRVENGRSMGRQCYLHCMVGLIRMFATNGVAVSAVAASDLFGTRWTESGNLVLAHLGIDPMPFRVPIDRMQVRQSLGIKDEDFVVGHVGRFCEQKNHTFLLEIASELVKREPHTVLLLLGDGPLRPQIAVRIQDLGLEQHVKLLGVRSDVPTIMQGAMDVLLFPSLYEGLPLVLLEAQAAGLPCVTSDNLTDEASVIDGLVTRLSLSSPPAIWAECVLTKRRERVENNRTFPEEFTIEAANRRLCELYDNHD